MTNFQKTIFLEASDKQIYEALTLSIPKWWTEMFEGQSNQKGETFTIRFGPDVFKKMKIEELIPNQKVLWHVVDSKIDIPDLHIKTEWIGTSIVWEISTQENQVLVSLTHIGLTPQVECYDICENGWHSFTDSLQLFVLTGRGNPFRLP